MDRGTGASGDKTMTPPRMDDSEFADKSEIYRLCRRVEQAKNRWALYAALDEFTACLTWLKGCSSKEELDQVFQRVADAADEESAIAALEDITAYLTKHQTQMKSECFYT